MDQKDLQIVRRRTRRVEVLEEPSNARRDLEREDELGGAVWLLVASGDEATRR